MKLPIMIRSSLLVASLALVVGVPGCGGGDDGGGAAGTSGNAGSGGSTGTGGTTGSGGSGGTIGSAGSGGSATSRGGDGGGAAGRGGNGGATSRGGNGGGAAGRGGNGAAGRGGNGGGAAGRGGNAAGGRGGSAGGAAGGTGGAATFAQVATILGASCGTGTCHDGADHVDLRNNAGLYNRIVNGMPNGARTMAACKTRTLIEPGDVASSVIAQVIMASMSGCTNARMPDECPSMRACLTAAQIATITSWIAAGAPM